METAHQLRCVRDWKWLWNLHSLQEEASSNVPGCGRVLCKKLRSQPGACNFLSKNTEKQWAYELETASFVLGTGPKMGLQYLGYCRTIWCPLCTAKSLVPVLEFQDTPWLLQQNMSRSMKAKHLHWPFGSCDTVEVPLLPDLPDSTFTEGCLKRKHLNLVRRWNTHQCTSQANHSHSATVPLPNAKRPCCRHMLVCDHQLPVTNGYLLQYALCTSSPGRKRNGRDSWRVLIGKLNAKWYKHIMRIPLWNSNSCQDIMSSALPRFMMRNAFSSPRMFSVLHAKRSFLSHLHSQKNRETFFHLPRLCSFHPCKAKGDSIRCLPSPHDSSNGGKPTSCDFRAFRFR